MANNDNVRSVLSFPVSDLERSKLQKKAEVGNRIRMYRKQRGLNQPQLAAKLGLTKNTITNWEAGISRPEIMMIPKLCSALDITADAFFGMSGEVLTTEQREQLKLFKQLDVYQQRAVNALMVSMIENNRQAFIDRCVSGLKRIDRRSAAAAGTGSPFPDDIEKDCVYLHSSLSVDRADVIIPVNGDSMQPTFQNGDELLVEYTPALHYGEIGVFIVAGEPYVKEYRADGLHSHNPAYDTIRPGKDDNIRCVGRVVGIVAAEKQATAEEKAVLDEYFAAK